MVENSVVQNDEEVTEKFLRFLEERFEGAMLRNADAPYENKRSYHLQKVKEFQDDDFDILGIEEGRGKLAGHVGAFVCEGPEGRTFLAKAKGDTEFLRTCFQDHSKWKNKKLMVQYQGLTGANKVPRFPVGVRIVDFK